MNNGCYRIVFNRALGVLQVVSELATANTGGRSGPRRSLRPHRLSQACALLLATGFAGMALPASAVTCVADATHLCGTSGGAGGAGSNGGPAGAGGAGSVSAGTYANNGGAGGSGYGVGSAGQGANGSGGGGGSKSNSGGAGAGGGIGTQGNGGGGGGGAGFYGLSGGGGGGGGGAGQTINATTFTNPGSTYGGNGGNGGNGGFQSYGGSSAYGGGGGGGGAGIYSVGGSLTSSAGSVIRGGDGGSGGGGYHAAAGGGGGAGIAGSSITLLNGGTVAGGAGGSGGGQLSDGGTGGAGGAGGAGFVGSGALTNTGTIQGGAGGAGANDTRAGGNGGAGGAGVSISGSTLNNSGSIAGGAGGTAGSGNYSAAATGAGGVGLVVNGSSIFNSGSISGGLSGNGAVRADAILFNGTGSRLNLQTGSAINGTIELSNNADATIAANVAGLSLNNAIQLDNAASALTFDASSADLTVSGVISGAGSLTKTGTGTVTLAGTNSFSGGTKINGGTLAVSADANLGATSGGVTLNAGTLENTAAFTLSHALTVGAGGGTLQTDANLTVTQAITGTGNLTQNGVGTLILAANVTTGGTQTYTGTVGLGTDVVMASTGGGNIRLTNVDGAHALTVNTAGITALSTVGGTTALTSLTTNAGGSTQLNGNVTTTGAQSYNDAVRLGPNPLVLTSTGNGTIGFASTLDGAQTLTVNTGGAVNFAGAVGGTTALSALTVAGGSFTANAMTINGGLSVTTSAGAISQGGAFTVAGASNFNAGNNAITLTNAGNDFVGAVTATGNGIAITDANDLTTGAVTSVGSNNVALDAGGSLSTGSISANGGNVALTAAGSVDTSAIDAGAGAVTVTSNGGTLSANGAINAGNVSLTSADALVLNADVTAAGSLALRSVGGDITQTAGGLTTTGVTSVTAAGAITLTSAANDFGGLVNLTGGDVQITNSDALLLGTLDTGNLTVQAYARLGLGDGSIAGNLTASLDGDIVQRGALTVSGTTSLDAGTGSITLANAGNDFGGAMSIAAGGDVAITDRNDLAIASFAGGTDAAAALIAGGTLTLSADAIDTGSADLALASNGGSLATVGALSGTNVSLTGRDGLILANDVTGTAVSLDTTNASIAQTGGSLTAATLSGDTGTGSVDLTSIGNAIGTITDFSAGDFNLVDGQLLSITGTLDASGDITLTDGSGIDVTGSIAAGGSTTISSGTVVTIGNGGTVGSIAGDVVDNGGLHFNHSDGVVFADAISGTGMLQQRGTGTLTLDGDSSAFAGSTQVANGTLLVGGAAGNGAALGGDVTVDSGATLGGYGTIGGNLAVAGGAHLAPGNSIGTLTIGGDASFAQGSELDYEFGTPGADFTLPGNGDSVVVGGNLTLDGAVLNVTDAGGMGPGLYRIFSWSGTLTETNGGLAFGAVPAGESLSLQTLSGQINLIDTTGMTLDFWNGNGLATASSMGGGDGTWSTTSANWTDANATVSAPMQPQPGFAIFGGAAGTVTIDNSGGAVTATGLQFASDGYTLQGDTLTLVGNGTDAPVIRVGDGSSAGAGYTATIDNVIAGTDGLAKTDAGTLVLTATNTFSGGVAIDGGELSVSGDANLGDAGNTLTLDGGLLQVTGTAFTSTARDLVLGANGGGFDIVDASNAFTVGQSLSGSGAFVKRGAGTLVLTGADTFTGGTTIDAGTLQLGNGGASGSITGDVVDNGTLAFDRSDSVTFAGTIGGTGALLQQGSGTTILTGSNTFGGGTTIAAGTLQLGNGGTTGMIAGNVTDNGTLVFDRSDDIAFAGTIDGNGALIQQGSGTLLLDSDDSAFAGSTDVRSGTLVVGSVAGNGAQLGGDVQIDNGAMLAGLGTIGGNVVNAGVLSPGMGVGSLSIHGDYTQTADGSLVVDAHPDGQADLVVVDGNATLDGSALVVATGSAWNPRTDYTILTTGGNVSGTFASTTSNLVFLDPVVTYDAQSVHLSLQRNDISFESTALTPNQRATAIAADTLGFGNAAYEALTTLDAAEAPHAFDALSGEVHASVQTALVEDSAYVRDAMRNRLDAARADGNGVWATGWGHWAHDDSDGNAAQLRTDGNGIAAGADASVGEGTRVGVMVGVSRAHARVEDRASRADVDSRHLGLYARTAIGGLQMQAGVAHSWHNIDSQRAIAFTGFEANVRGTQDGNTTQAYLDGSHDFAVSHGTVSPFLDLARVQVHAEGFTETGGDAALRVVAAHPSRTFATAGVRGAFAFSDAWRLQGSLGWRHTLGGASSPQVRESFATGSDAFVISGVPIADNSVAVEAGLGYQATPAFRINASYVGQFASDARDQGANLTLAWSF